MNHLQKVTSPHRTVSFTLGKRPLNSNVWISIEVDPNKRRRRWWKEKMSIPFQQSNPCYQVPGKWPCHFTDWAPRQHKKKWLISTGSRAPDEQLTRYLLISFFFLIWFENLGTTRCPTPTISFQGLSPLFVFTTASNARRVICPSCCQMLVLGRNKIVLGECFGLLFHLSTCHLYKVF